MPELLREYVRALIKEAMDPIRVKTLPQKDFNPPVWSDATEPRSSEIPQKKVGSFFMTKASDGMPSRGYGTLKKLKNFYVTLPDGEAIRVGSFPGDPAPSITKIKDGVRYLEALDSAVNVLPISDVNSPTPEDMENMLAMQDQIMAVARDFKI